LSLPEIRNRTVNIRVIANHQSAIIYRYRHLFQGIKQLHYFVPRLREGFGSAINDNKLIPIAANHTTAQEAAIIWLIAQNMVVTFRDVILVAATRVVQRSVRKNPKNELRVKMCKIANGITPPRIMFSEKWEFTRGRVPRN